MNQSFIIEYIMEGFPISSAIYILSALTTFIYSLRQWEVWRENRNAYALGFAWLSLGATVSFLIYSTPEFIPQKYQIYYGYFYVIGALPILLGLSEGLKVSFEAWNMTSSGKVLLYLTRIAIIIFFISHLVAVPQTVVDQGLIRWNPLSPWSLIFAAFIVAQAVPIGIFLMSAPAGSYKAIVKKILFGITFILGGLGGSGIVLLSSSPYSILLTSYLLMFAGFVFLAIIFVLDPFLKE